MDDEGRDIFVVAEKVVVWDWILLQVVIDATPIGPQPAHSSQLLSLALPAHYLRPASKIIVEHKMLLEAIVNNQKYTMIVVVPCFQLLVAVSHKDGSFSLNNILIAICNDVNGIFVSSFDDVLFESSEVFMEGLVEGMEQEDVLLLGVVGCVVKEGCDLVQKLVLFLVGIGLDGVGRG